MTVETARSIPALYAGVKLLTGIVSTLPIYLYSEKTGRTEAVADGRTALLNDDTGDLLDGTQLKAALVEDYLLSGRAYAFVDRTGTRVNSVHYVDPAFVGVMKNADPIFKTATLTVQNRLFEPESFIRMLNGSRDGVTGSGIVDTCNDLLDVARETLKYEKSLVHSGGAKKGFLKSRNKLGDAAMAAVREAWSRLWNGRGASAMVLNDGMDFMETSATSVEMQLNENKRANANEISKLLNIPPSVLDGTATDASFRQMVQLAVIPILTAFESACNRALLLESEKKRFYFAFDTKELFKGDALTRFRAYELALRNGFMQVDEVRFREDLPPIGFGFLRLGLQDVYYNPDTGEIYTPNTNSAVKLDKLSPGQPKSADEKPDADGKKPESGLTSDGGESRMENARWWNSLLHPRNGDGTFAFCSPDTGGCGGSGGGSSSGSRGKEYAHKQISDYIANPKSLANTTPKEKYDDFIAHGVEVLPLGDGSLKGKSFEKGGGYRIISEMDGMTMNYHPAEHSHHGGAYYKLSSGKTGTKRYTMDGEYKPI